MGNKLSRCCGALGDVRRFLYNRRVRINPALLVPIFPNEMLSTSTSSTSASSSSTSPTASHGNEKDASSSEVSCSVRELVHVSSDADVKLNSSSAVQPRQDDVLSSTSADGDNAQSFRASSSCREDVRLSSSSEESSVCSQWALPRYFVSPEPRTPPPSYLPTETPLGGRFWTAVSLQDMEWNSSTSSLFSDGCDLEVDSPFKGY